MAIQVRRGNEADFDANKMLPGEWAVSIDTKYVRMCFAPGVVLRMATYEGFESDKAQIQAILAECRSIQEVVRRIGNEVSEKTSLTIEYSNSAKESAERAKIYADNAEAVTGVQIATKDKAGLVKGGDNYIAEDGTLTLIKNTTDFTMPNSYSGRLKVEEIGGVCEQGSTAGKNVWSYGDVPAGTASSISWNIPAGTYTFSTPTTAFDLTLRVYFEDGNNKVISLTKSPITFTLENDVVSFNYNSTKETTITNIQVEAGTVATAYEPYTGGIPSPNPSYPQEIKKTVVSEVRTHGKNFFGFGKIAIDVTAELRPNSGQRLTLSSVDSNPNKVKCNFTGGAYSTGFIAIDGVDGTKEWAINFDVESNTTNYTPSIKKNKTHSSAERLIIEIGANNGGTAVGKDQYFELSNIQVEEGTVATAYEPYTESVITLSQPIELYGIGDVQDVIEDGKIKRLTRNVFDGSEDEAWVKSPVSINRYYLSLNYIKPYTKNIVCTHASVANDSEHMEYNKTFVENNLFVINVDFATLAEWKAHLQANPMTLVYELATPITEALPIADQIALNSLSTYDGITYLEFDSEIEPTFKGEYGTSKVGGYTLEGMLAGRNGELYGSRINALEASVVNNI